VKEEIIPTKKKRFGGGGGGGTILKCITGICDSRQPKESNVEDGIDEIDEIGADMVSLDISSSSSK
jgi:hypothetical protein